MMDLGILQAGTLLLLAAAPQGIVCQPPKPTQISVMPTTEKVELHTDKTLAQMQQVGSDTIDPHSFDGVSVMQGYSQARIGVSGQAKLDYSVVGNGSALCVWYDEISINFEIDPTIHIAQEVYADKCIREAVYEHEMKHVKTDRKIINIYSKRVAEKLSSELKKRGFVVGPIPKDQVQMVADRMQKTVSQILDLEYKRLELDRAEAQAEVDSLEEYTRVRNMCPDFHVTLEMINANRSPASRRVGR